MSKAIRSRKSTVVKIPEQKIKDMLFAAQFILLNPARSYNSVKYVVKHGQEHTTPQVGKHLFSVEADGTKHFLKLLEEFSGKDKMELQSVMVVETGLAKKEAKRVQLEPVTENMLRILINLREEESHVGLGFVIKYQGDNTTEKWLDVKNSFATVLPAALSTLIFMTGNGNVPDTRSETGKSVFVIMDIIPKQDTQYRLADDIVKHTGVTNEQFTQQVKRLHNDGKMPTEQFEEFMKDPSAVLAKMTGSGQATASAETAAEQKIDPNLPAQAQSAQAQSVQGAATDRHLHAVQGAATDRHLHAVQGAATDRHLQAALDALNAVPKSSGKSHTARFSFVDDDAGMGAPVDSMIEPIAMKHHVPVVDLTEG